MANYICQVLTPRVSSRFLGKIKVPAGGLTAGSIILADTLDNTIIGNIEVFSAIKPLTQNLGSNFFALVLNDGFETLEDGRRPAGQPNYYQYEYGEGDIAPIVFLEKHLMINIGIDSIEETTKNLAVVGNYLIPVNNSNKLNAVTKIPDSVNTGLKIVGLKNVAIGGQFGGGFALSLICTPIVDDVEDAGNLIYDFTIPNQIGTTIIDQTNGTINLFVDGDRSNLIATFIASRDSIVKVNNVTQVSGTTANDFTNPVTYTVTSEKGIDRTYTVTISLPPPAPFINIQTDGEVIMQGSFSATRTDSTLILE